MVIFLFLATSFIKEPEAEENKNDLKKPIFIGIFCLVALVLTFFVFKLRKKNNIIPEKTPDKYTATLDDKSETNGRTDSHEVNNPNSISPNGREDESFDKNEKDQKQDSFEHKASDSPQSTKPKIKREGTKSSIFKKRKLLMEEKKDTRKRAFSSEKEEKEDIKQKRASDSSGFGSDEDLSNINRTNGLKSIKKSKDRKEEPQWDRGPKSEEKDQNQDRINLEATNNSKPKDEKEESQEDEPLSKEEKDNIDSKAVNESELKPEDGKKEPQDGEDEPLSRGKKVQNQDRTDHEVTDKFKFKRKEEKEEKEEKSEPPMVSKKRKKRKKEHEPKMNPEKKSFGMPKIKSSIPKLIKLSCEDLEAEYIKIKTVYMELQARIETYQEEKSMPLKTAIKISREEIIPLKAKIEKLKADSEDLKTKIKILESQIEKIEIASEEFQPYPASCKIIRVTLKLILTYLQTQHDLQAQIEGWKDDKTEIVVENNKPSAIEKKEQLSPEASNTLKLEEVILQLTGIRTELTNLQNSFTTFLDQKKILEYEIEQIQIEITKLETEITNLKNGPKDSQDNPKDSQDKFISLKVFELLLNLQLMSLVVQNETQTKIKNLKKIEGQQKIESRQEKKTTVFVKNNKTSIEDTEKGKLMSLQVIEIIKENKNDKELSLHCMEVKTKSEEETTRMKFIPTESELLTPDEQKVRLSIEYLRNQWIMKIFSEQYNFYFCLYDDSEDKDLKEKVQKMKILGFCVLRIMLQLEKQYEEKRKNLRQCFPKSLGYSVLFENIARKYCNETMGPLTIEKFKQLDSVSFKLEVNDDSKKNIELRSEIKIFEKTYIHDISYVSIDADQGPLLIYTAHEGENEAQHFSVEELGFIPIENLEYVNSKRDETTHREFVKECAIAEIVEKNPTVVDYEQNVRKIIESMSLILESMSPNSNITHIYILNNLPQKIIVMFETNASIKMELTLPKSPQVIIENKIYKMEHNVSSFTTRLSCCLNDYIIGSGKCKQKFYYSLQTIDKDRDAWKNMIKQNWDFCMKILEVKTKLYQFLTKHGETINEEGSPIKEGEISFNSCFKDKAQLLDAFRLYFVDCCCAEIGTCFTEENKKILERFQFLWTDYNPSVLQKKIKDVDDNTKLLLIGISPGESLNGETITLVLEIRDEKKNYSATFMRQDSNKERMSIPDYETLLLNKNEFCKQCSIEKKSTNAYSIDDIKSMPEQKVGSEVNRKRKEQKEARKQSLLKERILERKKWNTLKLQTELVQRLDEQKEQKIKQYADFFDYKKILSNTQEIMKTLGFQDAEPIHEILFIHAQKNKEKIQISFVCSSEEKIYLISFSCSQKNMQKEPSIEVWFQGGLGLYRGYSGSIKASLLNGRDCAVKQQEIAQKLGENFVLERFGLNEKEKKRQSIRVGKEIVGISQKNLKGKTLFQDIVNIKIKEDNLEKGMFSLTFPININPPLRNDAMNASMSASMSTSAFDSFVIYSFKDFVFITNHQRTKPFGYCFLKPVTKYERKIAEQQSEERCFKDRFRRNGKEKNIESKIREEMYKLTLENLKSNNLKIGEVGDCTFKKVDTGWNVKLQYRLIYNIIYFFDNGRINKIEITQSGLKVYKITTQNEACNLMEMLRRLGFYRRTEKKIHEFSDQFSNSLVKEFIKIIPQILPARIDIRKVHALNPIERKQTISGKKTIETKTMQVIFDKQNDKPLICKITTHRENEHISKAEIEIELNEKSLLGRGDIPITTSIQKDQEKQTSIIGKITNIENEEIDLSNISKEDLRKAYRLKNCIREIFQKKKHALEQKRLEMELELLKTQYSLKKGKEDLQKNDPEYQYVKNKYEIKQKELENAKSKQEEKQSKKRLGLLKKKNIAQLAQPELEEKQRYLNVSFSKKYESEEDENTTEQVERKGSFDLYTEKKEKLSIKKRPSFYFEYFKYLENKKNELQKEISKLEQQKKDLEEKLSEIKPQEIDVVHMTNLQFLSTFETYQKEIQQKLKERENKRLQKTMQIVKKILEDEKENLSIQTKKYEEIYEKLLEEALLEDAENNVEDTLVKRKTIELPFKEELENELSENKIALKKYIQIPIREILNERHKQYISKIKKQAIEDFKQQIKIITEEKDITQIHKKINYQLTCLKRLNQKKPETQRIDEMLQYTFHEILLEAERKQLLEKKKSFEKIKTFLQRTPLRQISLKIINIQDTFGHSTKDIMKKIKEIFFAIILNENQRKGILEIKQLSKRLKELKKRIYRENNMKQKLEEMGKLFIEQQELILLIQEFETKYINSELIENLQATSVSSDKDKFSIKLSMNRFDAEYSIDITFSKNKTHIQIHVHLLVDNVFKVLSRELDPSTQFALSEDENNLLNIYCAASVLSNKIYLCCKEKQDFLEPVNIKDILMYILEERYKSPTRESLSFKVSGITKMNLNKMIKTFNVTRIKNTLKASFSDEEELYIINIYFCLEDKTVNVFVYDGKDENSPEFLFAFSNKKDEPDNEENPEEKNPEEESPEEESPELEQFHELEKKKEEEIILLNEIREKLEYQHSMRFPKETKANHEIQKKYLTVVSSFLKVGYTVEVLKIEIKENKEKTIYYDYLSIKLSGENSNIDKLTFSLPANFTFSLPANFPASFTVTIDCEISRIDSVFQFYMYTTKQQLIYTKEIKNSALFKTEFIKSALEAKKYLYAFETIQIFYLQQLDNLFTGDKIKTSMKKINLDFEKNKQVLEEAKQKIIFYLFTKEAIEFKRETIKTAKYEEFLNPSLGPHFTINGKIEEDKNKEFQFTIGGTTKLSILIRIDPFSAQRFSLDSKFVIEEKTDKEGN